MVRYYIRVSGYVQGVGFRYFVQHTAGTYGLTGWVRNLEDGGVDMEVQGEEACAEAMVEAVRRGSRYSQVRAVEVKRLEPVRESGFWVDY